MMSGSERGPHGLLVDAFRTAIRHPVLTLVFILPPVLIPYAGQDRILVVSLSLAELVLRCGVYGSFTAPARGEPYKGPVTFAKAIAKFILRYVGLGLLFGVPFITVTAVVTFYVGTPENLTPIVLAVGYPVLVLASIAIGIMFNRDGRIFSSVGEAFSYIAKVWPVFVILGAGTVISLGRYHLYGTAVPEGFDPLLGANLLLAAFLELLGFLYVTVYIRGEEKEAQLFAQE